MYKLNKEPLQSYSMNKWVYLEKNIEYTNRSIFELLR